MASQSMQKVLGKYGASHWKLTACHSGDDKMKQIFIFILTIFENSSEKLSKFLYNFFKKNSW